MIQHRVSVQVNKPGSKQGAGRISGAARYILKHFGAGAGWSTGYDQTSDGKSKVVTILIDGPKGMNDVAKAAAVKAVSEVYHDNPDGDIIMYGGVRVGEYHTGDCGWSPDGWRPITCQAGEDKRLEIRNRYTRQTRFAKLSYGWGRNKSDDNIYIFEDGSPPLDYKVARTTEADAWEYREVA